MKLRVFPSHKDLYNSIVIDTDKLNTIPSFGHMDDSLPTIFICDLITDLISQN